MNNLNIIKKQVLDIRLKELKKAYEIQNKISLIYYDSIVDVLDKVCSVVAEPGEYIKIDRLEIDLGEIPVYHLEEEFVKLVRNRFFESLLDCVSNLRLQNDFPKEFYGDLKKYHQVTLETETITLDKIVTETEVMIELLKYFLQTGQFPWWVEKTSNFSPEKICFELVTTAPQELRAFFKEELTNDRARHRLLYQFSDSVLLKILELTSQHVKNQVISILEDMKIIHRQVFFTAVNYQDLMFFFWDTLLQETFIRHADRLNEAKIFESVFTSISKKTGLIYSTLLFEIKEETEKLLSSKFPFKSSLPSYIDSLTMPFLSNEQRKKLYNEEMEHKELDLGYVFKEKIGGGSDSSQKPQDDKVNKEVYDKLRKRIHENQENMIDGTQKIVKDDNLLDKKESYKSKISFKQIVTDGLIRDDYKEREIIMKDAFQSPYSKPISYETDKLKEESQNVFEIFIENAGLIILWPFFSNFFKKLSLMEDDKFNDEALLLKAVHLLQYLVTGHEGTSEYFLSLNKVLCGLDVEEPIGKNVKLSDEEKAESEELVRAVTAHWSALKNTSVSGFRLSFLQRRGVLNRQEKGWLLRVERKAYDMLLERLPWSISIIKLSWMKTILYVQW